MHLQHNILDHLVPHICNIRKYSWCGAFLTVICCRSGLLFKEGFKTQTLKLESVFTKMSKNVSTVIYWVELSSYIIPNVSNNVQAKRKLYFFRNNGKFPQTLHEQNFKTLPRP